MQKQPIIYVVVRFQPHVETGEFANVGIVLVAPQSGYFDYRIETHHISRLTRFFRTIEPALIRQILNDCGQEMARIRSLGPANIEQLFKSLTKDREGVIRFSDPRFAVHENPPTKLDELFEHYVVRDFADA